MVFPVQPMNRGRSTSWKIEVMVTDQDFHLNFEPLITSPSIEEFLTSGFQLDHLLMSAIKSHIVSGLELISIIPLTITGAFSLILIIFTPIFIYD